MTSMLTVRRVESPRALAALAADSNRLAHAMQPRVPFATNDWLSLWWRHFREDRLWVRDEFYVHTVRDEHGALVALAPLMLTERPANGPLRCRSLAFFGGDKNVTELRGLICAPEHEAGATRALLAHFDRRSDEWDWFSWNGVRSNTEAHAVLHAAENFEWRGETTDYVLPLPSTWEEFRAGRSRNIKESLRKCYNSLERASHTFSFRAVSDPLELPLALQHFFALHARRANAPHLVRHEDVFATTQARKLLLDLAASTSETAQLRVFQLAIAGKVVASRLGFLMGDELYLYFSGYEPDWGAFSVMTTTVAESIKWAIEHKFRLVNLSPGTDVSKTRWGASAITTCEGVLLSRTRRGRLAFGVLSELHERSRPGTLLAKMVSVGRRHG
jgi:CelD/BcsL family acetyltransferase involved in cellulose biosynthesis